MWSVLIELPREKTRTLVLSLTEPTAPGAARVPEQPLSRPLTVSRYGACLRLVSAFRTRRGGPAGDHGGNRADEQVGQQRVGLVVAQGAPVEREACSPAASATPTGAARVPLVLPAGVDVDVGPPCTTAIALAPAEPIGHQLRAERFGQGVIQAGGRVRDTSSRSGPSCRPGRRRRVSVLGDVLGRQGDRRRGELPVAPTAPRARPSRRGRARRTPGCRLPGR